MTKPLSTTQAKDYVEYFRYLDNLRESGVTNMFGAAPYVAAEFGIGDREARAILSRWMSTYDGTDDIDSRAEEAAKLDFKGI